MAGEVKQVGERAFAGCYFEQASSTGRLASGIGAAAIRAGRWHDYHGLRKPQLSGRFGNESIAAGQTLGKDDDAVAYFLHFALGTEGVAGEGHRLHAQGKTLQECARSGPFESSAREEGAKFLAVNYRCGQVQAMSVLDIIVHAVPVPGGGAVENQVNQREGTLERGEPLPRRDFLRSFRRPDHASG